MNCKRVFYFFALTPDNNWLKVSLPVLITSLLPYCIYIDPFFLKKV